MRIQKTNNQVTNIKSGTMGLKYILNLPRLYKRLVSLIIDTISIVGSFYAAYWTRIGDVRFFDDSSILYVVLFINVLQM